MSWPIEVDIKHRIIGSTQRRQCNAGQKVQVRNYYGKYKWYTGKVLLKKGHFTREYK